MRNLSDLTFAFVKKLIFETFRSMVSPFPEVVSEKANSPVDFYSEQHEVTVGI